MKQDEYFTSGIDDEFDRIWEEDEEQSETRSTIRGIVLGIGLI